MIRRYWLLELLAVPSDIFLLCLHLAFSWQRIGETTWLSFWKNLKLTRLQATHPCALYIGDLIDLNSSYQTAYFSHLPSAYYKKIPIMWLRTFKHLMQIAYLQSLIQSVFQIMFEIVM